MKSLIFAPLFVALFVLAIWLFGDAWFYDNIAWVLSFFISILFFILTIVIIIKALFKKQKWRNVLFSLVYMLIFIIIFFRIDYDFQEIGKKSDVIVNYIFECLERGCKEGDSTIVNGLLIENVSKNRVVLTYKNTQAIAFYRKNKETNIIEITTTKGVIITNKNVKWSSY